MTDESVPTHRRIHSVANQHAHFRYDFDYIWISPASVVAFSIILVQKNTTMSSSNKMHMKLFCIRNMKTTGLNNEPWHKIYTD